MTDQWWSTGFISKKQARFGLIDDKLFLKSWNKAERGNYYHKVLHCIHLVLGNIAWDEESQIVTRVADIDSIYGGGGSVIVAQQEYCLCSFIFSS